MKNYSVKNKNYCVNNEKYCVNKLIYCVNNFGFDIQTLGCAQLASPQGSLHFVNPYPDLCNLQGNAQETELFYYHPDHLGSTGMVTDNLSNITAGYLYAPFGEILQEHLAVDNRIPKYAFNAKELDEENGMYYYSARYYAPPTFISRDPMFEKYPSISPYTYCANNPMKYVDPTGKCLDGYINGEGAEAATAQLDASTSLTITRDTETGKLDATGEIKTQQDQELYNAIHDPTIRVDITATYSDEVTTSDGKIAQLNAGAFMGNTVSKETENENTVNNNKPFKITTFTHEINIVNTKQTVNPFQMAALDFFYGNPGETMLHEFMESYIGGQTSQKSGESANPAINGSPTYYIYENAHRSAPKQPGEGKCNPSDFVAFKKLYYLFIYF